MLAFVSIAVALAVQGATAGESLGLIRGHVHGSQDASLSKVIVQADGDTPEAALSRLIENSAMSPKGSVLQRGQRKREQTFIKASLNQRVTFKNQNYSPETQQNLPPPTSALVPQSGLYTWFKNADAGVLWPNSALTTSAASSGSGANGTENATTTAAPAPAPAAGGAPASATAGPGSGNGSNGGTITVVKGVTNGNFITGAITDTFTFGAILPPIYTICSVTRYGSSTLANMQRILTVPSAGGVNWIHGHWAGGAGSTTAYTGVAFYGQWATSWSQSQNKATWVALCGMSDGISPSRVYADYPLNEVANGIVGPTGSNTLSVCVNCYTATAGKEFSDFAIMEVITWNRLLTPQEAGQVLTYFSYLNSPLATTTTTTTTTTVNKTSNITVKSGSIDAKRSSLVTTSIVSLIYLAMGQF